MRLADVAKILYVPGTASENAEIIVRTYFGNINDNILYRGKAKDLQSSDIIHRGWIIVQILVDHSDEIEAADYNKRKIIEVI